jgi:hypothetical protein
MSSLKNFMQKCLQSQPEKRRLPQNDRRISTIRTNNAALDEKQVILLTRWLNQLDRENLVTITGQNDIVIMAGGMNDRNQQIFINSDDVHDYMRMKTGSNKAIDERSTIGISDIARILLIFGYVNESAGQLSFKAQTIEVDSDELRWLMSIVYDARPDPQSSETHVKLFDGENTQLLSIPYEFMAPTSDVRTVANYLFRNGHVRYDVDAGVYAYRYVEPDILLDDQTQSPQRTSQRQLLSFHIRRIHVNEEKKRVEVEFLYEPLHGLVLPARWYPQLLAHRFDRNYIIDVLLANGGVIDRDTFFFMGHTFSLRGPRIIRSASASQSPTYLTATSLPSKQKYDLIRHYVDYISAHDGTKQDETSRMLILENAANGHRLYFTPEHSQFIRRNQFQRQDVIDLLVTHGQIKQDSYGNWFLYYNDQCIQFPRSIISWVTTPQQNTSNIIRPRSEQLYSSTQQLYRPRSERLYSSTQQLYQPRSERLYSSTQQLYQPRSERLYSSTQQLYRPVTKTTINDSEAEFRERYRNTIDYMCRNGLVTWDKRANVIKLQFSDQTSLLPIDHLRSSIDSRAWSSGSTAAGALPFTSRQLSEYLLNNSYITRKTY